MPDAGTQAIERKRFRLWLEHTESRMQSHILAGVSSSSWPSLYVCSSLLSTSSCPALRGSIQRQSRESKWVYVCERERDREREREQPAETITAESGRNGAKSGSRPHLMKHHKYSLCLSFFLLYLWPNSLSLPTAVETHTNTHTHTFTKLYIQ